MAAFEEIMMYFDDMMGGDYYDWDDMPVPTYEEVDGAMMNFGYTLTQAFYDMMFAEDDSTGGDDGSAGGNGEEEGPTQEQLDMIMEIFGTTDLDEFMGIMGEIYMYLYPDMGGDYYGDDWEPTFEDVEAVFTEYGYYLSMEVFDILMNMEDPSMLNMTEWDYLYQSFNTQDQEAIMTIMGEMMMSMYPDDMYGYDDYEITFDDAYMAFEGWGYNLTQEVFDMLQNMEDPSMLGDNEWNMLYDMFGSQDQQMIMTQLGEIMMSMYPDDMGDDMPTYDDVSMAFSDMGYNLTQEVYDILCYMEDPSMLNMTEWDYLYQVFGTQDQG